MPYTPPLSVLFYIDCLRVDLDTPVMGGRFSFWLILPGFPAFFRVKLKYEAYNLTIENPEV